MGGVFVLAFWSLDRQIEGLLGPRGLRPAGALLAGLRSRLSPHPFLSLPTVLWWAGAGPDALHATARTGLAAAALAAVGLAPLPALALAWLLYLSLVQVGGLFLSYQWDALLLEAGLLAVAWAPAQLRLASSRAAPPSRAVLWLLRWLAFRLMFFSGWVKLASGDPAWRHLRALEYHYWTQPIPAWTSWYAVRLPAWLQSASCAAVLGIELVCPWLIFAGRRGRAIAAASFLLLQAAIAATGNYGFFNLLTAVLCLPLLDDAALGRLLPTHDAAPRRPRASVGRALGSMPRLALAVLLGASSLSVARAQLGLRPTVAESALDPALRVLRRLDAVNGYGLFAVMTKTRPEVTIEATEDGRTWRPYVFRWKAGPLDRAPAFVGAHMPRLDWQMWFDALRIERALARRTAPGGLVTPALLERLAEGSPPVLALLERAPFPPERVRALRWALDSYRFTDAAERRRSGRWWRRERRYVSAPVPRRSISSASRSGPSSRSDPTTRSASRRSSGAAVPRSATTAMPAARAAATPAGASSTTTQRRVAMPSRSAARSKTSGSGLPRTTSRPVTTASKRSAQPRPSRLSATFSGGPEEATAKRKPAPWSERTRSAAPSMAGNSSRTIAR